MFRERWVSLHSGGWMYLVCLKTIGCCFTFSVFGPNSLPRRVNVNVVYESYRTSKPGGVASERTFVLPFVSLNHFCVPPLPALGLGCRFLRIPTHLILRGCKNVGQRALVPLGPNEAPPVVMVPPVCVFQPPFTTLYIGPNLAASERTTQMIAIAFLARSRCRASYCCSRESRVHPTC